MARRSKPKFNKTQRVKALARERIGAPKPARILEERPNRTKHPKDWQAELESDKL